MAETIDKYPLAAVRQARAERDTRFLLEALRSNDRRVRGAAARSLGLLNEPAAVAPLVRLLRDPDYGNRVIAVKALARLNDPEAVPPLYDVASGTAPIGLRAAAMTALLELGDRRAIRLVAELAVSPTLERDVAESPMRPRGNAKHLRRWAMKTLREQDGAEALPVLDAAVGNSTGLRAMRLRHLTSRLSRASRSETP